MKKETGGPAFPFTPTQDRHMKTGGMTLRDYFAAKAMQAFINGAMADGTKFNENDPEGVSHVAFLVADAMLKARSAE